MQEVKGLKSECFKLIDTAITLVKFWDKGNPAWNFLKIKSDFAKSTILGSG
jgi:hypothetical protein